MPELRFSTMRAADLLAIERQPSQQLALGMVYEYDAEEAAQLAAQAIAWTVRDGSRIIACFGVAETFEGRQGWGWALLAPGVGYAHLALTRFVRGQVEACGLPRLEVLAKGPDIEAELTRMRDPDPGEVLSAVLAKSSPEVRWGQLLGLRPAHVLRCYGALSETYVLFEYLRPGNVAAQLGEAA